MMRTKEWLINKRTKYCLTQRQLAKEIGISSYTIENIEQGKRLGSAETWKKIEEYFCDENSIYASHDNNEVIEEIKGDILEFGEDHPCILIYKRYKDYIIFTDYTFNPKEMPFNAKKELNNDEQYIETTLKYAYDVFENQNKIV